MTVDLEQRRESARQHCVHAIHADGTESRGGGRSDQMTTAAHQSTKLRQDLGSRPSHRVPSSHPLSLG